MRFLYVSRQFNRSGYYVLEYLLRRTSYRPVSVLLPSAEQNPLDDPNSALQEIRRYRREAKDYGCPPIRFHRSIRMLARSYGIGVVERPTVKDDDFYRWLQEISIDLLVLGGGWPQLLPVRVLSYPRLGTINTHPSLLPAFRGTDVHRWQIFHNVKMSGCTIHYVDHEFDTGDIIAQTAVPISSKDTPQALFEKASRAAGPLMKNVLDQIVSADPGRAASQKQSSIETAGAYFSKWDWNSRDFLRIDWSWPADQIARFILACVQESYQYHGPFFNVRGKEYIVREALFEKRRCAIGRPGQILGISGRDAVIRCGTDSRVLRLKKIQPVDEHGWTVSCHPRPAGPAGFILKRDMINEGDILNT